MWSPSKIREITNSCICICIMKGIKDLINLVLTWILKGINFVYLIASPSIDLNDIEKVD